MIDGTLDTHCWRCFSQNFSQISKSNFLEPKNGFGCFFYFWLTAGDALSGLISNWIKCCNSDYSVHMRNFKVTLRFKIFNSSWFQ